MSSNHHKLYLDAVFALAKTIRIKSEYSAAQMNTQISTLYGAGAVHPDHPETWKYYLNATGQYHPTDTMMQVISLDTLQTINFTKANLVLHPATQRGYQYGTRYYKELVAKFPNQESLILGILYPAEMANLLAAENHSIVSYNPSLVEANEEQLIPKLTEWTQAYFRRWWVNGFNINHSLYAASFFAVFYQQLVLKILEIRELACSTPFAHSFHVRMHLASYHGLDEFLPYLTQKQAMWLYRNIAYITRYAGWQSTFKWLVDNLLTGRGLPLVGYDLVHDATSLLDGDVAPLAAFRAVPENNVRTPEPGLIDYRDILAKVAPVADGNVEYDARVPDAIPSLRYQAQNTFQTKVLESSFVNSSGNSAVSSIEMALTAWAYTAFTNRFNVYTRINHPVTGNEITLSSTDAYYLFLLAYASCHSSGMPTLSPVRVSMAPVWPVPQFDVLWNICDQEEVDPSRIAQMRDLMAPEATFINLDQFRQAVSRLETSIAQQGAIVASADTFQKQTSYKSVFTALWQDHDFTKPETGQNTLDYLNSKGISLGMLDPQQWQDVYLSIFSSVTGLDMQSSSAQSAIQLAMIEIMRRLSSYSVIFVDPVGSISSRALGWSNLIIQETADTSGNFYEAPICNFDAVLVPSVARLYGTVSIGSTTVDYWVNAVEQTVVLDNTSDIVFTSADIDLQEDVRICSVGVTPFNAAGEIDETYIVGLQEFLNNPVSFFGIPNIYNSDTWPNPTVPTKANPNDWLVIQQLPILSAPELGPQLLIDFRPFSIPQNLRYFSIDSGIIELDAFESNYGDTPITAFEPLVGHEKLTSSFTLMPYFEPVVPAWESNIGNVRSPAFDPYAAIVDYIELDGFTAVDLEHQLDMRRGGPLGVTSFDVVASGNASFSLHQGIDGLQVTTTKNTYQTAIGSFTPVTQIVKMRFSQNPVQFDIGSFVPNIVPFVMGTLQAKTAIYHLGALLNTAKAISLPKLTQIGTLQIDGFIYWGATHLTVSYDGPVFVSYSSLSDAATHSSTNVLQILDMQAELALV